MTVKTFIFRRSMRFEILLIGLEEEIALQEGSFMVSIITVINSRPWNLQ